MNKSPYLFILVIACAFFASCKPGVPKHIIKPGVMEDILYDFHVADGMAQNNPAAANNVDYNRTLYRLGVLKKYNVTQADFDSSMVYYSRHSDRLHDIYEDVAERLSQKALSLGATAADVKRYGTITADGDTANVWLGERSIVLMSRPPYNNYSFNVVADSAYRKGDRMILNFDSNFIIQDGSRDGVAVLAVKFGNDSTASKSIHFSGTQHQTMEIIDNRHLGVKEVKGFFYMNTPTNYQNSTMLRLISIYNIRLIRFHERTNTSAAPANNNADSSNKPTARRDSAVTQPKDSFVNDARHKESGSPRG